MVPWLVLTLACFGEKPDPGLTVEQVARYVRSDVKDKTGWAADTHAALVAARVTPDADHVCQVLAIVEQESGYDADPAVSGLGDIARAELESKLSLLGPLAPAGLGVVLDVKPSGGSQTFGERLDALKTERDLDLLFREIVSWQASKVPGVEDAARTLFSRRVESLNPVTTAGSMQVSVSWSQELGRKEGLDALTVRDLLYTRAGGLKYGTARLFTHDADYDDPKYRFADYNAGVYASRNAAFQTQVAKLTDAELAPDGDLLVYNEMGEPKDVDGQTMTALLTWRALKATDLPESRLRADARREKERRFEETDTWARVRADYEGVTGKPAPYARVPDVSLDSPKLSKELTTRWFAEKVDGRYEKCLIRGK